MVPASSNTASMRPGPPGGPCGLRRRSLPRRRGRRVPLRTRSAPALSGWSCDPAGEGRSSPFGRTPTRGQDRGSRDLRRAARGREIDLLSGPLLHTHVRLNLDMLKTRMGNVGSCGPASRHAPAVRRGQHQPRPIGAGGLYSGRQGRRVPGGRLLLPRVEDCRRREESAASCRKEVVPFLGGLLGTAGRMELPSIDEGFDELHYVRIDDNGGFVIEGWRDEDR